MNYIKILVICLLLFSYNIHSFGQNDTYTRKELKSPDKPSYDKDVKYYNFHYGCKNLKHKKYKVYTIKDRRFIKKKYKKKKYKI